VEAIMGKYMSCSMAAMLAIGAMLSAVKTSEAGAFPVDTATAKIAAPQDVVEARYYGGGYHDGGAFFAGAALGLFGAALAAPSYYGGYYPAYNYPGYAYAPYWGYGYYPRYYGYWGYPRYRYYGYGGYPRYWHYGYRRWR
jgi:hypothetical protein